MVFLGQIMAFPALIMTSWIPPCTVMHKVEKEVYYGAVLHCQDHRICRKTPLFLRRIGLFRFKAVKGSYLADGMVPRVQNTVSSCLPQCSSGVCRNRHPVCHPVFHAVCWLYFYVAVYLSTKGMTSKFYSIIPQEEAPPAHCYCFSNRKVAYPTWC